MFYCFWHLWECELRPWVRLHTHAYLYMYAPVTRSWFSTVRGFGLVGHVSSTCYVLHCFHPSVVWYQRGDLVMLPPHGLVYVLYCRHSSDLGVVWYQHLCEHEKNSCHLQLQWASCILSGLSSSDMFPFIGLLSSCP